MGDLDCDAAHKWGECRYRPATKGMGVRLGFCTLANGHAAALRAHGPVRARVAHGIRNRSAQRDMNFHQIVRTDLHVERFGEMSRF